MLKAHKIVTIILLVIATTTIYLTEINTVGHASEVIQDTVTKTTYLSAGELIAQETNNEIEYVHTDRLKSKILTTDNTGTKIEENKYQPYGKNNNQQSELDYTGKTKTKTSTINLGAREYNPQIKRFTTTDPILQDTKSPYNYVDNNPLKYIDPDGKEKKNALILMANKNADHNNYFEKHTVYEKIPSGVVDLAITYTNSQGVAVSDTLYSAPEWKVDWAGVRYGRYENYNQEELAPSRFLSNHYEITEIVVNNKVEFFSAIDQFVSNNGLIDLLIYAAHGSPQDILLSLDENANRNSLTVDDLEGMNSFRQYFSDNAMCFGVSCSNFGNNGQKDNFGTALYKVLGISITGSARDDAMIVGYDEKGPVLKGDRFSVFETIE